MLVFALIFVLNLFTESPFVFSVVSGILVEKVAPE